MEPLLLALVGLFSVAVGLLIGAVGIGGVLLVPMLTFLLGLDIHTAIAAAMFSYLFSGAVGALIYARQKSIAWKEAGWLMLGAWPGAFAGAALAFAVPARALEFLIALLIVFAGLNALRTMAGDAQRRAALRPPVLIVIGAGAGLGSALSGTGGPLLLVPVLVLLRLPALAAIGLAQVMQLPIAAAASIGNALYGTIDIAVGLAIAAGLTLGVVGGAKLAHRLSQAHLRRIVAWVLVAVGLFIVARIAYGLLTA